MPEIDSKIALWDDPAQSPDFLNRAEFAKRVSVGFRESEEHQPL